MDKIYRRMGCLFVAFSMILLMLYSVRIISKMFIVNKLKINSSCLQYIADYTLGDWREVIIQNSFSTDNNSQVYYRYDKIYNEMIRQKELPEDESVLGVDLNMPLLMENYKRHVEELESNLNKYSSDKYMGANLAERIEKGYKKILNWGVVYARSEGDEFALYNGYTWKATEEIDGNILSDEDMQLYRYLRDNNVNYLKVILPSRISPDGKEVPIGAAEFTNINLDKQGKELQKMGISYYDLREDMYKMKWTPENGFFKTDPHWTPESGFMAAGLIAEYLNKNFDFNYRVDLFKTTNYTQKEFSLNDRLNDETVTVLFPNYSTKMIMRNFDRGSEYRGSFEEAMFDFNMTDPTFRKRVLDIYSGSRIRSSMLGMIESSTALNQKRILFSISSTSWYIVPYMAIDCKDVFFTTGATPKQLEFLIEQLEPDMVISI